MKFLAVLALSTLSFSAFSQTCYVDMVVKNTGRVVQSFLAYGGSDCKEGMKECRKSIRLDYSANPQYPNGTLDCVRAGDYGPIPQPYPHPMPQPIPQPLPRPVPGPQPLPRPVPHPVPEPYRSLEANSLIQDMARSSYTSEVQVKIAESFILDIQSYHLAPLARVCSSARTWSEQSSCLMDGLSRAPREMIDESSAIFAIGRACMKTKSWQDEKSCFSVATRNNRLPSLGYLTKSCENMYMSESAARCYRSVFGVQ